MPAWEYKKINLLDDVPLRSEDIDALDVAGKDGWELVLITQSAVAYLKRGMTEAPTSGRRKTSASAPDE